MQIVVNDTLCPRFTKEQEKYMPVIHNYFNEHRDLFDYVKNYSGLPDDNLIAFGKVYDSLSCEVSIFIIEIEIIDDILM